MIIINIKDSLDNLDEYIKSKIVNHYLSLSEDDLYTRFFSHMSESSIRSWLKNTFNDQSVTNYFFIEEVDNQYIGILQVTESKWYPEEAEIAVSVSSQYQKTGIASRLLKEAIEYVTSSLHIKKLFYCCLINNPSCNKLFKKFGFDSFFSHEQQTFVGTLLIGRNL